MTPLTTSHPPPRRNHSRHLAAAPSAPPAAALIRYASVTCFPLTPSKPPRKSSSSTTLTRRTTSSPQLLSSLDLFSAPPPSPAAVSAPASPPCSTDLPPPSAIYLFPATSSTSAVDVSDLNAQDLTRNGERELVLIAFDGTWKHAREMVKASEEFLQSRFAVRVCLGVDESVSGGSIYDSELILRKEPFSGCVSTMEAVARVLRVLEPNGVEIERMLIGVLREMVRLQAGFLKPMNPRPKLLKKSKEKQKRMMEKDEN